MSVVLSTSALSTVSLVEVPAFDARRFLGSCHAGRYTLLQHIGSGAHGHVFRAYDDRSKGQVAIKLLDPGLLRDQDAHRRLAREAHLLGHLHHPNIVTFLDYVHEPDQLPFIVMEYVRGRTLSEHIDAGATILWREAIHIVMLLLSGLETIHAAGIVHADIKAANIIVERAPLRTAVTLLDFGIAHWADDDPPQVTREHIGDSHRVCGTPGYIAPEVILGQPSTPASDVYGVGVTGYHLLTGQSPFPGHNAYEVLKRQLATFDAVADSTPIHDAIPLPLRDAIGTAMAPDPTRRFATATAFQNALRAILQEHAH